MFIGQKGETGIIGKKGEIGFMGPVGRKGQKGAPGPDTESAIEMSTLSAIFSIFMSGLALVFSSVTLIWMICNKSVSLEN